MDNLTHTSDRVKVCRCADCVYFVPGIHDLCVWHDRKTRADDYCSNAERRIMCDNCLREETPEKIESGWISVKDRLPKSLHRVLIAIKTKYTGKYYITTGSHCNDHEVTTDEYGWTDYEGDTEYDEEKDCFWVKGGWWETNFIEDNQNWEIDELDGEVTHWMELPDVPKEDSNVDHREQKS